MAYIKPMEYTPHVARTLQPEAIPEARDRIEKAMAEDGVALLPALDVFESLDLVSKCGFNPTCIMLDPWYNKGLGGEREQNDYDDFVRQLLEAASQCSPHTYFWGFPEIVARFVTSLPANVELRAWLTWYYKNNPSVIRGWRSAQMTCLHLTRADAVMHPEHFLNEAQLQKKAEGKLRYMPGPPSVIEGSLIIGFVGKREQTGHPAQKPEVVLKPLIEMATVDGELVFDPLCGSGTVGAVCTSLGRRSILSDHDPNYVALVENRLGIKPVTLPADLFVPEGA